MGTDRAGRAAANKSHGSLPTGGEAIALLSDGVVDSVTSPDSSRRLSITRQMNVPASARRQPLPPDRVEEADGGPVIEDTRRGDRGQVQADQDRMSVTSADALAVWTEREPLLVVLFDDPVEQVPGEGDTRLIGLAQHIVSFGPARIL